MNKATKRIFAIVLLALMLSACAKEDKADAFIGIWRAKEITAMGQTMPAEDASAGDWVLEIKKGGRAYLSSGGDTQEFSWLSTEEGIVLNAEEDGTVFDFPARLEEDDLIVTMLDFMDVRFIR